MDGGIDPPHARLRKVPAMQIDPQPLTRDAFAPYGDVIDIPTEAGRQ